VTHPLVCFLCFFLTPPSHRHELWYLGALIPHLGQFDTNYIIFRNVKILTIFIYLFQERSFFEKENKEFDELFEKISFVEIESWIN
jgi:hypothetical protein